MTKATIEANLYFSIEKINALYNEHILPYARHHPINI